MTLVSLIHNQWSYIDKEIFMYTEVAKHLKVSALMVLLPISALAQYPYHQVEPLGEPVNTIYNESQAGMAVKEKTLYIVRNGPTSMGQGDVFVHQRQNRNKPWGEAVTLGPNINSPGTEFDPTLSPDQHWLFFTSRRSGSTAGSLDIWAAYREDIKDDFGWQPAINPGPSINSIFSEADPALFTDPVSGNVHLYFASAQPPTTGIGFDIFMSVWMPDGTFTPAVRIPELSGLDQDGRMTVSEDGLELVLTSRRPGSMNNSLDLWYTKRASTDMPWPQPINMGPEINTIYDERGQCFSGKKADTLYFTSERPGGMNTGVGIGDVYTAIRND
jgi:WD40-like Beta Propeller Repeat